MKHSEVKEKSRDHMSIVLSGKADLKRSHNVLAHLFTILKSVELETERTRVVLKDGGQGEAPDAATQEQHEVHLDAAVMFYLDCGAGYTYLHFS